MEAAVFSIIVQVVIIVTILELLQQLSEGKKGSVKVSNGMTTTGGNNLRYEQIEPTYLQCF